MRKVLNLLLLPFAFLAVALMRYCTRWKLIRIGEVWSDRLGHLIGNTECYLAERDAGLHAGCLDLWFFRADTANAVISNKYRKLLHTIPEFIGRLIVICNQFIGGAPRHQIMPAQFDRDIYNLWKTPYLTFTRYEEWKGKRLLKRLGIKGKWVCLMVRDDQYLKDKGKFDYHDYRDSDVGTYGAAVVELLNRGYTVIRMGVKVGKPLAIKHSRFIDYAWEHKRTAFADLYLGAKCEFAFGTACGFMSIPQAFDKPVVYVNHAPLEYIPTSNAKALLIWKHHVKDGKRMTLPEIFASGAGQFTNTGDFVKAGITLQDNTSQEIWQAVTEMADNIDNAPWKGTQPEFWSKFPIDALSPYNNTRLHGKPGMRVGREFMKGYA